MDIHSADVFSRALGSPVVQLEGLNGYSVDGLEPDVVLRPVEERQVAVALGIAEEHGLSIVPWGGGTQIGLGNPPRSLDAVMELSQLSAVVDYQPADLTATAQAGVTVARLQEELAKHGQMMPLNPPRPKHATLGGTVAANVSGPWRLAFGTPRDLVLGVRVAHPDGTITKAGGKVVKNVTGYDLNKLYVGSLGTLGVLVEVTIRTVPLPTTKHTVLAAFSSLSLANEASLALLSDESGLLAICVLNGSAGQCLKGVNNDKSQALVLVEAGGRKGTVDRRITDAKCLFTQAGAERVEVMDGDDGDSLWCSVGDLAWGDNGGLPLVAVRCGVLPTQVNELCASLEEVGQQLSMTLGLVSLAGNGSGVLRSLWWPSNGENVNGQTCKAIVDQVRMAASKHGTYAVVERCPPVAKESLDAWGPIESVSHGIMQRLKQNFDPRGVLSPGRFVGGI